MFPERNTTVKKIAHSQPHAHWVTMVLINHRAIGFLLRKFVSKFFKKIFAHYNNFFIPESINNSIYPTTAFFLRTLFFAHLVFWRFFCVSDCKNLLAQSLEFVL
eukprot:TRINITY_DN2605_c0_g2_i1.p5 TRINITY_DN2605_c0_g2~~TRINITY_DN2605_c0_g2_i1.p5  ORF type:complete len:104 (-),score=10.62 TRINITY_DN2605_c0_g2_i1:1394-1705(-)